MRNEDYYLLNNSMRSLLELGNFLSNKQNAFQLLVKMVQQFERSLSSPNAMHSARVAALAEVTGMVLSFSEDELQLLKQAAYLHDLGKLLLPSRLFLKEGQLSAREWQMVRLHPELGAALIKQIPHLLPLLPGILYHHERFNGSGYPFGLQEQQIPLMGRIIGMVDCFEALTATRPYHTPLTVKQALFKMKKEKEQGLWDPYLFEIFSEIAIDADYFVDERAVDFNLFKN